MSIDISTVTQTPTYIPSGKLPVAAPTTSDSGSQYGSQVTLDTFSYSQQSQTVTYSDPRANNATKSPDLTAMLEESDKKAQAIIDLIQSLVKQQGLNLAKVASGQQRLSADPAAIAAAQAAIGVDGEFGVNQTSARILSFAKLAIGNDPFKFDTIRAAVEKGFNEAQQMLGGTLPEISQQTMAAIESQFDQWKANGMSADAATNTATSPATSQVTA